MFTVTLEYPLTRAFLGRWFAPLVLVASLISIVCLTVVNVAVTGYETITVFNSDFNFTHLNWFDRWVPSRAPQPGKMCDTHSFSVGDNFLTNYTIFQWSFESINVANAGKTGLAYNGSTLDGCDVSSIFLNGDMRTWSLDVSVVVVCRVKDILEVNGRTAFTLSSLPGTHTTFLGAQRANEDIDRITDPRIAAVYQLTASAAIDLGFRVSEILRGSKDPFPVIISLQADFPWCPASLGVTAECNTKTPEFKIPASAVIFSDTSINFFSSASNGPPLITNATFLPISNILQTIYSAVRLDLGNPSPNNFYLNDTMVATTLSAGFPAVAGVGPMPSELYEYRVKDPDNLFPSNVLGPAQIQLAYLCRYQKRKSNGQLFISVFVATISMFSAGWATFMFFATWIMRRRNPYQFNTCEGHTYPEHTFPLQTNAHLSEATTSPTSYRSGSYKAIPNHGPNGAFE